MKEQSSLLGAVFGNALWSGSIMFALVLPDQEGMHQEKRTWVLGPGLTLSLCVGQFTSLCIQRLLTGNDELKCGSKKKHGKTKIHKFYTIIYS